MKFEKITKVRLPFDRRHTDDQKNYGIGGLDVWFILKGPRGAVQFAVNFPQYLPHIDREYPPKFPDWNERKRIMGFDVGYHALEPQFEGQTQMGDCDVFDGKPCYYDGSGLRADTWVDEIFSVRGKRPEDILWAKLEEEYYELFGKDSSGAVQEGDVK